MTPAAAHDVRRTRVRTSGRVFRIEDMLDRDRGVHGPLTDLVQRRTLVHGDVIGLVALDLVLRLVLARMTRMSLIFRITSVGLDDPATHMPRLGIPADVIADLELPAQVSSAFARSQTASTVRPYFSTISLPGADAPKVSTLSTSPPSPT